MNGILIAGLAFLSTSVGGLAAIRIRDRLHLLLGFSVGAVLGVAFFDIFPELINRSAKDHISASNVMLFVVIGFLNFFLLERITSLHGAREHEHQHQHGAPHHSELGVVAAAGLSLHSFLDGVAIAVGFKASVTLGLAIGLAVLAHDFSDGLNTVTVVLAHGNPLAKAVRWLLVDATTPVLGAVTAFVAPIPSTILPYILAIFAGFFLYIGSSDLLPEAREHDSPWVVVATLVGLLTLYGVTRVV